MNTYGGVKVQLHNFDTLGGLDFSFVSHLIYPKERDFVMYW